MGFCWSLRVALNAGDHVFYQVLALFDLPRLNVRSPPWVTGNTSFAVYPLHVDSVAVVWALTERSTSS